MKKFKTILIFVIFGWFTYISFEGFTELNVSQKIADWISPIIGFCSALLCSISMTLNDINDKLK